MKNINDKTRLLILITSVIGCKKMAEDRGEIKCGGEDRSGEVRQAQTFLRMYLKCKAAAMRGMIRPSASRERIATIARRMCQPR